MSIHIQKFTNQYRTILTLSFEGLKTQYVHHELVQLKIKHLNIIVRLFLSMSRVIDFKKYEIIFLCRKLYYFSFPLNYLKINHISH
uniref:Putative ovule protein n=1 Tax=Solanum chacoense TaxID=4108 RepID=A0A0V0GRU0_SOLCH